MGVFEFILLLVVLAMVYSLIAQSLKKRRGEEGPSDRAYPDEEQMVRELYRGLERMERRLEALETLLADREQERRASTAEKRL